MSRKVQIVNLEKPESERDVVVTNESGEAQTIRPGRTLDLDVGHGSYLAVAGRHMVFSGEDARPVEDGEFQTPVDLGPANPVVDPVFDADDQPAFEVHDKATGHIWKVYADGRTEGFPADVLIFNRIPSVARAAQWSEEEIVAMMAANPDAAPLEPNRMTPLLKARKPAAKVKARAKK
ncbi:hypothetical protein NKI25_18640 [Mesorhizobium sp. M0808]|uniref:hypothetical protein n=1 Tax=Mesorhizobium sp. M0808 TaxID=2957002 RepID=UPI00333828E4